MGMEPPILDRAESSWGHGGNRLQNVLTPDAKRRIRQEDELHVLVLPQPTRRESSAGVTSGEGVKNVPAPPSNLSFTAALVSFAQYSFCIIYTLAAVRRRNCGFNHKWIPGFQFTPSLNCWNSQLLFSFYHYHIQLFFYFDLYPWFMLKY